MTLVKNAKTKRETTKSSARRARPKTRRTKKTKKDQLINMLSKPNGAKVSTLCKMLGWQNHTVRAALSGLRKQGLTIETSKSVKDGETVYAVISEHGCGVQS